MARSKCSLAASLSPALYSSSPAWRSFSAFKISAAAGSGFTSAVLTSGLGAGVAVGAAAAGVCGGAVLAPEACIGGASWKRSADAGFFAAAQPRPADNAANRAATGMWKSLILICIYDLPPVRPHDSGEDRESYYPSLDGSTPIRLCLSYFRMGPKGQ